MENFGNSHSGNEPEDKSRRDFFKNLFKLAAVSVVAGPVLANVASSSDGLLEKEEAVDDLVKRLEGNEASPAFVIFAASKLVDEMTYENLKEIGTLPIYDKDFNEREIINKVDYLRNFITKHLNSETGKHYKIREDIFHKNSYTIFDLEKIIERAKEINENIKQKNFKIDKEIPQDGILLPGKNSKHLI